MTILEKELTVIITEPIKLPAFGSCCFVPNMWDGQRVTMEFSNFCPYYSTHLIAKYYAEIGHAVVRLPYFVKGIAVIRKV